MSLPKAEDIIKMIARPLGRRYPKLEKFFEDAPAEVTEELLRLHQDLESKRYEDRRRKDAYWR